MRRSGAALLLIIIMSFMSCGRQGAFPPAGSYSDIVLVTDTGEPGGINDLMIRTLQHQLDFYSKNEVQFKLKMIPAVDIKQEPPTKNMVIFGVAREGEVGKVIESFLGTNSTRKVIEGKNFIFKKMDYPYVGQMTLIVTASSREKLKKVVMDNGQLIRDIIEEANRERLRANLLSRENIEAEKLLRGKYGFSIKIPSLYRLNQDKPEVPGIELVRIQPHRGITISWRHWDKGDVSVADSTALYDFRSDLAWKMYDKDVMRKNLVYYHFAKLGPYDVVKMEGYWENSQDLYGGPFMAFFICDRARSRLWIVDCVIYAPGFDKNKLIREAWSVAETFRIN